MASICRYRQINSLPPVPKFDETLPTVYSADQTKALLDAADPYNRVLILLSLKCGLREQIAHLEFKDIDHKDKILTVRSKPHWGFKIKNWEQRQVPLPDDVLSELGKWGRAKEGRSLVSRLELIDGERGSAIGSNVWRDAQS